MDTIQQFLERGTLGPISLGLDPIEVQRLLGMPADVGGTAKQRIWKYGSLQLGFQRDQTTRAEALSFIGLYFRAEGFALPPPIRIDGWFPSAGVPREDFVRYLADHDMGYAEDARLSGDTQSVLSTKSGASVIFAVSPGTVVLDSIQLIHVPKRAAQRPAERCARPGPS